MVRSHAMGLPRDESYLAGLLPDLPENIRQNIFRVFAIAGNSQNERKRDSVVSSVKGVERGGIFGSHTPDQFTIFFFYPLLVGHRSGILSEHCSNPNAGSPP